MLTSDKTFAEVVPTGSEFTAFVLEKFDTTVERVISCETPEECEMFVRSLFPDATIVEPNKFNDEVHRRILLNMERIERGQRNA